MIKHRFKALLFDLDGTLIDSAGDLQKSINAILESHGLRALSYDETKRCTGDGLEVMLTKAFALAGSPQDGKVIRNVMPAFNRFYGAITPDPACIYNDALAFLADEKANGTKLGLCTNKYKEATFPLMAALKLDSFFDIIVGGNSLEKRKPDPDQLLHALQHMGVAPKDAVMIGDSINDALAARAARMPCIILKHGYGWEALTPAPDLFFADNIPDCRNCLASI